MIKKKIDSADDGWLSWSKYVVKTIEHLNDCVKDLKEENTELKIEVAKLKLKSGIIGAVAGVLVAPIVTGILWLIIKKWIL